MSGGDGRLESYIDLLTTASRKTGKVRDNIEKIMDTLEASTSGRGEPWGNDTLGKGFADGPQGYIASRTNMIEGGGNMAGTFGNFSKGQADSAAKLQRMEDGNRDSFK
ncbi:hypothetical protein [Nocardia yamanashiensis]|uniref:hypothetical protein n=1 Tax=Nocardia yamanashiensis TaxID=209247 RepID=UPI000B0FF8E8|nr:hypothetical protein [Nocardia yamanashiensis]